MNFVVVVVSALLPSKPNVMLNFLKDWLLKENVFSLYWWKLVTRWKDFLLD
jgi:hypothetical protein